jgi:methyltransferase
MGLAPWSSRVWFTLLVAAVAAARLAELRLAARNRRQLLALGAHESSPEHYPWMVTVQTSWLVGSVAEVWLLDRPFLPLLGGPMLVLLLLAFALRYWVIATLGPRWTTRILTLPGQPLVTAGPYRFLHHPNYLAVSVEVAALPLVHTAWWSAIVFSLANGLVLAVRIRAENAALAAALFPAARGSAAELASR